MLKNKKAFIILTAVLIFIAGLVIFLMMPSEPEHIEDTNGADDFSLQQLTDEDIITMQVGALNLKEEKSGFSEMPEYSSDKFSGVSEIYRNNITGNRFDITLYNLQVNSGNFSIVLVHNDEIVHEFALDELTQTYTLKNPGGTVSLRIAGESADFSFSYALV